MESKPRAQPSRKGKKAWRKNIAVDDIDDALEAQRDREIAFGPASTDDFVIDTTGDSSSARPAKVLRTTEILTNKSKVPALNSGKIKKVKVSKARVSTLMALAGRSKSVSSVKARAATESLVKGAKKDLWGEDTEQEQPEIYRGLGPVTSYTPASKPPPTLHQQPVALKSNASVEKTVHAGKSYNPSLESWQTLIDQEYGTEHEKELQLQANEEQRARIQHLIETLDDREVVEEDSGEEAVSEDEEADDDKYRLSINKPTEVKIKTRVQRNKQARHKQRLELEAKLKALKAQYHELSRLPDIEKEVDEKLANTKTAKPKEFRRHGKHEVSFKPIEVKLSDELSGSLRGVRPEGNLFYDQMHKLQSSGKVPASVPVEHTNRYKPKFVEKWSYKQWRG